MKRLLTATACVAAALASPWTFAADANLGRNLAATCANCHGTDGRGLPPLEPLVGYPADKLITRMAEFKAGTRPAFLMQQISKGYTEEQVALIAAYFASQKR